MERFLEEHKGYEFVGFTKNSGELPSKLGYYHIFMDGVFSRLPLSRKVERISLKLQRCLRIHYYTDMSQFSKGCNWWSITNMLASALLEDKEIIFRKYKYTSCSDEIFVQTFIKHHPELNLKIYNYEDEYEGCMRLIDWNRGGPYTFKECDYEELLSSNRFFARKFGSLKTLQGFMASWRTEG